MAVTYRLKKLKVTVRPSNSSLFLVRCWDVAAIRWKHILVLWGPYGGKIPWRIVEAPWNIAQVRNKFCCIKSLKLHSFLVKATCSILTDSWIITQTSSSYFLSQYTHTLVNAIHPLSFIITSMSSISKLTHSGRLFSVTSNSACPIAHWASLCWCPSETLKFQCTKPNSCSFPHIQACLVIYLFLLNAYVLKNKITPQHVQSPVLSVIPSPG